MADLPPLPPRRTTAERPLPPRASRPERRNMPLPAPVGPSRAAVGATGNAAAAPKRDSRPVRPDPRPMRVVYGAGAMAAASVMAVGLVQPDFTATAQQAPTVGEMSDGSAVALGDAAGGAGLGPETAAARDGRDRAGAGAANPTPRIRYRHVTRYVQLKPGQTAPPGATVIFPGGPTPRADRPRTPRSPRTASPAPRQPGAPRPQPTARPQPQATPRQPQATARPTPKPTPRPTATTRQSGARR